jgi:hypothetical protein
MEEYDTLRQAKRAYQGLYNLLRPSGELVADQKGREPSALARRLVDAMPLPGSETKEDRAFVFLQLKSSHLEDWYGVRDESGARAHEYASAGLDADFGRDRGDEVLEAGRRSGMARLL